MPKMSKFRLGGLLAAALCLWTPAVGAPTAEAAPKLQALSKIAVVDIQRCFLETTQGKKAQAKIKAAAQKTEKRLAKKSAELRKGVEDLRNKAAMLAPKELERRQQELMRKDAELQKIYAESTETLAAKEAELTATIYRRVQKIVAEMAKKEGLQAVIVRSQASVLYAVPTLDLTNKVILAYDKKHKK